MKVKEIIDNIIFVVILFTIVLIIKSFYAQPYNIPSGSMKPTLLIGDFIFVKKYVYGYSASSLPKPLATLLPRGRIFASKMPKRGDIVVFRNENDSHKEYIKRVIGLEGDRIQVIGGRLYINGEMVEKEEFGNISNICSGTDDTTPLYNETLENRTYEVIECDGSFGFADNTGQYIVPEGHFFMMGDNRDESQDSRFINDVGYVPYDRLVGTTNLILFSVDLSQAKIWEVWNWYKIFRGDRFFKKIHDE